MNKVIYLYLGEHENEKDIDATFIELLKKADIFVFETDSIKIHDDKKKLYGPLSPSNTETRDPFQTMLLKKLTVLSRVGEIYFENPPKNSAEKERNNYNALCTCRKLMRNHELNEFLKRKSVTCFKEYVKNSIDIINERDVLFLMQIKNLLEEYPDKNILTYRGIQHLPFFSSLNENSISVITSTLDKIFSKNNVFWINQYMRELNKPHDEYNDEELLSIARYSF